MGSNDNSTKVLIFKTNLFNSMSAISKRVVEALSEPNGTISWGRSASSIALIAGMIWVSYILLQTHALPALDGITAFILGPYASNKAANAVQSFSNQKQ